MIRAEGLINMISFTFLPMYLRLSSYFALCVLFVVSSCTLSEPPGPEIVGPEPSQWFLVERDSISTGSLLGLSVGTHAADVYDAVTQLRSTQGVTYLNIVSNQSSDIRSLENRIPLYSYILLDEQKGTDKGVQITLEEGKVSAIFLNSGRKLSQWPERGSANASVSMGDAAEGLHTKLVNVSKLSAHASRFQKISLLTKDLARAFDPAMADSPQWYFAYLENDGALRQVQIFLKDGRVDYLISSRMVQTPGGM